MLRLELECLEKKKEEAVVEGIYQDKTGDILQEMKRAGEVNEFLVTINNEEHAFIAEPSCSTVSQEVRERFEKIDDFLERSGHFGALIAYVALAKVWDELNDTQVNVMPEGSYSILYHTGRDPDALMIYPNEFIPVEVYNGRDYLDTPGMGYQNTKYRQLQDYADVPAGHDLNCNPFLISRRSTDDFQSAVRQWDGMVIDTDCIIACEKWQADVEDNLDFFGINESVEFIPEVEASDGTLINGEDYNNTDSDSHLLRPTSTIAENEDKIPPFYMERVRGGIQLHYVNSYYRRRHDANSVQACRVVQELYNQLLRQDGKERDTAINDAWDGTRFGDAIDPKQRGMITEEINNIINELAKKRIIYKRKNKIYARRAEHPQQDLSFTV